MTSYYPSQGSHRSHRSHHSYAPPVGYSSSHDPRGYEPAPYAPSGGYNDSPYGYNGNTLYVPSSHHSHSRHRSRSRSRHNHPTVVQAGYGATIVQPSASHHSHHSRRHHHRLTLGERIMRFFGFGRHRTRHESRNSSWGFFGRSRRRRYVDARTGGEVDRKGRPVIRY